MKVGGTRWPRQHASVCVRMPAQWLKGSNMDDIEGCTNKSVKDLCNSTYTGTSMHPGAVKEEALTAQNSSLRGEEPSKSLKYPEHSPYIQAF